MNGHFCPETLQILDESREVHIETRRDQGSPVHRTIVWVVVVSGEVFVRSVRGPKGRWYQKLLDKDGPTTEAVSDAIRSKYQEDWPGPTAAMVRPDVLPTTLKLSLA